MAGEEYLKHNKSLREVIAWLKTEGDVLETDREVDPDLELVGLQKHMDGGPVLFFNNVKGMPHARAVTNLFSDINVVDKMFGFEDGRDRTRKLAHSLTHPLKPVEISHEEAPVQQHVLTENLDVNQWITAIRHTKLESELTIGSGISCVIGDYFDGGSHIGYNRMNFRRGNVS
ncbi:MAG: UbiD family decarboxylase, partial [bacterium]